MFHIKELALSAAISLLLAPAAWAAQKPGISYDCDTAADHFSELILPAPEGAFVVSGRVQVNKIAPIGKYVPLTRIAVAQPATAPGGDVADMAGFVLTALPGKSIDPKIKDDKLVVQFVTWDERSGSSQQKHDPFGLAAIGEKLDFSLAFAGGTVTARVAGQERQFALKAQAPVVRLICSTGEFLFTDLRIE